MVAEIPQIPNHTHNGIDSPMLSGSSFSGCPFPALTTQTGSLTTGGTEALTTDDANTIMNTINRVIEIEDRLRTLGIII